jgi:hypothetical protein
MYGISSGVQMAESLREWLLMVGERRGKQRAREGERCAEAVTGNVFFFFFVSGCF